METFHIILIVASIVTLSMLISSLMYTNEINNFCKENGFEYSENYDSSHACWKNEPTKLVVKKIKCEPDWISVFTFRNPYRGCKFMKIIEVEY